MYTINLKLLSVNCVFVVFFSKQANCCLDNHLLGKQANCLSPFRGDGRGGKNTHEEMSIPCLPSYHQSVSRNKKHEKTMRVLFVNFILLMLYKIKQQETSRYVCFNQYSIHLQIETYLIPFRKLRNFYEKVTEFLQESYRLSKS